MSPVYVEPDVILLPGAGGVGQPVDEVTHAVTAEAIEAITHLSDAGHHVVLVAGSSVPPELDGLPSELATEAELPGSPPSGSWLLTADPDVCARRPAGFRTVLVGPRRGPGPRPTAHCDFEARDLSAAVIEILTREAMA